MPEPLVPFSPAELQALRGRGLQHTALAAARRLFQDDDWPTPVDRLVHETLDFSIPLVPLASRTYVLELFHGPTLAFKDVGARWMARLMTALRGADDQLTVLVATSGDTGGAVARAFHGFPGTRVIVLYPQGKVSDFQERQFATLGDNVLPVAVQGSFDDCQRLTKLVLENQGLRSRLTLTSANSINIGRLLPQIFYAAHAWAALPDAQSPVIASVPSGNFGNLTAALMAKRLGIPIDRFVAATNVNDVVPTYLTSGDFRPRPSVATISSAMDVGHPSNFSRIRWLYGDDIEAMRRDVVGYSASDDQTRACIRRVYERVGYILDPHSAVGLLGLEAELEWHPRAVGILFATAHPAKFASVVEPLIGRSVDPPDWYVAPPTPPDSIPSIGTSLEELIALL
jgi:threonine synthase